MCTPIQFPWNKPLRQAALRYAVAAFCLVASSLESHAQLGLPHESYGVWDRGGYDTVAAYPVTRGQEYVNTWQNVNSARHTFDWSSLDAQLQFADSQNENFIIQIEPVGGGSSSAPVGQAVGVPPWILAANGGGVAQYTDGTYQFGDYRDPNYRQYYTEMVQALAYHVRQDPALAANLRARIAFVRVDTGTTGDEVPYQNDAYVLANYPLLYVDKNTQEWIDFRKWAFGVYRAAFQDGAGPVVPMLYQAVDNISNVQEWNWVVANVHGGFGAKFGGNGRGHHLTNSDDVPGAYKAFTVNPAGTQLFTRNEMDNTFLQTYFQLNIQLNMYWAAVEQLNAGMSVWDVNQNCLQDSLINNYTSTFQFFNQWAAEVIPATAGGGFCIFHQGLDSQDQNTYPPGSYGGGSVLIGNTARYTAICQAYSAQGAQMDDLNGATVGSNIQRGSGINSLKGFNDAGWNIVPGNYERFITQINPDTTSKALWRINGPLTSTSHPYDRFARRSDHASGNDTMYFDINNNLLPTVSQRVQLNVTYLDRGTGQFSVKYDAVGNAQKTGLTVSKTGSNTWMTQSVVVTDWVFGNHGPSGCDLQLVNLATDASNPDTIFHGIEVIKLADVSVGTVGKGTVTGRNNAVAYSAIPSSVMQGQRLELTATPAPGWAFTGWSGALTGSNPQPFLFPTKDTRLTATFVPASVSSSSDDFNSGTWSGGSGWNGDWATSGTITSGSIPQLSGGASITRTLATPLTGATLSFDYDLDRIATSESGKVEVYNGSSWVSVWNWSDKGLDDSNNPNLVTSGNISLSGTISQIRFTLNATGGGNFYIDNVSLTGTPAVAPNSAPLFSSDPIGKDTAIVGSAYAGTLSGSASDPNSNPMTFSKLSGGPAWLSVAADGTLSGTPLASDSGLNSWNVQVASSGGSDTAILLIYVSAPGANPPTALSYSSNPATYTIGTAITNNTPASTGGSVIAYSVSPALPAGLTLDTSSGVISGTPTAATPTASYMITAVNNDGSSTATLNLTVNDIAPSALTYSSNPATYTIATAITNNNPTNSGGAVVSYSVTPALPTGLTLNTTTGVINGTPTAITATASYTVTATNTKGSTTASLTITVNDIPPTALSFSNNPAIYTANIALTNSTRSYPTSSGGAVVSYSVSPALPTGLALSNVGQTRGTPSVASPTTVYTVTATNSGGSTTATLTITVNAIALAPTNLTYSSNSATYTKGTTITSNTPTNTGGAVASYAVSPALPAGLTLNTTTGVISGTPTAITATANYTVTATNSTGFTTATVSITVNDVAPSALTYSSNPATYTKGTAVTNTPTNTGGAVVSYAVTPTLPAGLTLNTTTGVISGTPTTVTTTANYTVTATNTGGSTTASLTITVNDVTVTTSATYSNSSLITINDNAVASPYPSMITVPTTAGTIAKVTVQLNGFSHSYPNDVAMLLVGPSGQKFLLMYHKGGNTRATNANLTFSDLAAATLPSAIVTGTYKPSAYSTGTYAFPSPAPTYPYLSGALSTFNGTNPTGVWSLYVRDDAAQDSGTLSGGWSLSFDITQPAVVAPSALSYSNNPATYTKGTAITSNTPTSSGGAVVSYAISPALPTGLTLNTSTGVISGTPTAVTSTASYTVTATNTSGSTTASVSITVNDAAPSALTYSTNPAAYTKGTAITTNTPSSGGGPVVSYAVSPALPAGLALNTTTGVISGTPTAVTTSASYTVTAANSGGSTIASVSITVNDAAPSALTYSTNPAAYTKGTAITTNTPSSGGGAVVSYAVSPALPAGLALNTTTGVISGTPTAVTSTASYAITATNTGGSTTASVSITVNDVAPSALAYSSNPATYTKGTAITSNTPTSSGGAVISYAVSPALPTGLTLNTSTGVISGTPTAVSSTASYTVTATNTSGSTTASVSITVNDVAPSALAYSNNPATYLKDSAIPSNTPTSSGGAVVSYAISPALPTGLAMNTTTGVISGTPTAVTASASYTVTAANSGGSTTASVSITVNDAAPSALTYSTNPAAYTKGTAISSNTPTSGGGAVVSYAVSPALPAGLAMNTSTGVISGTPTAVTTTASYTVTAANSGGSTTASVSITINDAAPSALTYSSNPATYTKGTAITSNTPTSSGGAVISYAVSPALPTGLTLNTSTGVITGTPTAVTTIANYTITATNASGSTAALVSITVNDAAPSALAYSTNPATYLKDSAIPSNTPTSSGGAVVSYAVSPALPTGLALNASTGVISGTPTVGSATASYTVTATNSGGSTAALLSIAVYDGVTVFATSGTWTCPSGVTTVTAECWGGGGAGGAAFRNATAGTNTTGGGGAGGAYSKKVISGLTPGNRYTVTVGAGGVSVAGANDLSSVPGGDSWFNTAGTVLAKGGAGGIARNGVGLVGAGGVGSTAGCIGDVLNTGGSGSSGNGANYGGGGGSSGGTGLAGINATGSTGAAAVTDGGPGGNGATVNADGSAPVSGPGGGGGGARGPNAAKAGGAGGPGQVILTYTVTVTHQTIVESWRQQYFGTTANSGTAADSADPDGDGYSNLLEFAFGTDPTSNASGPGSITYAAGVITQLGQPAMSVTNTSTGVDFKAVFGRRQDYLTAGLTYTVQFSADLITWQSSTATPAVVASAGGMDAVTVRYPFFLSTGEKAQYFRVQVSRQ